MRIIGAQVNAVGPAPEAETITLINASPATVDLTGWHVMDRAETTCPLPATALPAGATIRIDVTNGMQLGNQGGAITLLDANGAKIHGVSYTAEQGRKEGWTVVF